MSAQQNKITGVPSWPTGYSSDQYWRDSRAGAMEREQQQRAWDQEQRAREIEWRQQQLQRQVDDQEAKRREREFTDSYK